MVVQYYYDFTHGVHSVVLGRKQSVVHQILASDARAPSGLANLNFFATYIFWHFSETVQDLC